MIPIVNGATSALEGGEMFSGFITKDTLKSKLNLNIVWGVLIV